jgi:hypothetical protein
MGRVGVETCFPGHQQRWFCITTLRLGETLAVQPESRQPNDGERQPDQGLQDLDPASELQDLSPEIGVRLVNDVDADDGAWIAAEPSGHRGARNPEAGNDSGVPGLTDQGPESRIVGPLISSWRCHAGDLRQDRRLDKAKAKIVAGLHHRDGGSGPG